MASQTVQPAYVGEEAVSDNARGKSMETSAPISVLTGPPSGRGDFLAPIPAPTLRLLDSSAKLVGHMLGTYSDRGF